MNRIRLLAALMLVVAFLVPVFAQDALSKRVSLDLKAVEPSTVFNTIAGAVGLKVTIDPAVTAPVDIVVRNVRASTALDAICDSIGCSWKVANGTLSIAPASAVLVRGAGSLASKSAQETAIRIQTALGTKLPAGLVFTDANFADVGARLSAALGLHITMEADGPGPHTLTADLSGHTLQTALKIVVDSVKADMKGAVSLTIRLGKEGEPQQSFGLKWAIAPKKKK